MNLRSFTLGLRLAFGVCVSFLVFADVLAETDVQAPAVSRTSPHNEVKGAIDGRTVRLLAVGDILFHRPLIRALKLERSAAPSTHTPLADSIHQDWIGAPEAEVSWPFSLLRHLANRAELVVGNLETPINERRLEPPKPMRFSSPMFIAEQLAAAGFSALSIANNHSYDQGQRGLSETLEHLKTHGVLSFGLSENGTPYPPTFVERNGISFAFIGYSFLTNRLPDPLNDKEAQINLISKRQRRGRKARLKTLDKLIRGAQEKADYVIVSVHWGEEYMTTPNQEQQRLAKRMTQAGADLILGHHPHVLQPVMRYERTDDEAAIVAYSLGNYVANQSYYYNLFSSPLIPNQATTRDSVILEFEFSPVSTPGSEKSVTISAHPVWLVNRPSYQEHRKAGRRVEPRLISELQDLKEYQEMKRFQRRLEKRKRIILRTLGVEEAQ